MALTPLVVTSVTAPGVSVMMDKIGTDYWPTTEMLWGPYGAPVPVDIGTPLPIQVIGTGTSAAPLVVSQVNPTTVWTVQGNSSVAQIGPWPVTAFQGGTWAVGVNTLPAVSLAASASVGASQVGVWTVQQGTPPWSVTQSGAWIVTLGQAVSLAAAASVVAVQGGTWTVQAAQSGTWNVNAAQSGVWVVTVGQMPAVSLAAAASVAASQVGVWVVSAVPGNQAWLVTAAQQGLWKVTVNDIVAVSLAANASVAARQTGTWSMDITSLPKVSIADQPIAVSVVNALNVSVAGVTQVSLAAGTSIEVRQIASWPVTVERMPAISVAANASIATSQVGVWIVSAAQSGPWVVTVGQAPAVSLAANASVLAQQGGAPWSVNAAQSGVYIVTVGQMPAVSLAANASVLAQQGGAPWGVSITTAVTSYTQITSASTNARTVKAAPALLYGYSAYNNQAVQVYLKLYNLSSISGNVSLYSPARTVIIPGASAGSGANISFANPINFSAGLSFAVVGSIAINDTTSVGLNDAAITLDYL